MEKKNMEENKSNSFRDALIVVVVLLGAALAYFIFSDRPTVAQEHFNHPDVGQGQGVMPDIEQLKASLPTGYDELVQQGNHFMDNRVYPVAIEAYSRALAQDSSDVNVMVDLGACMHAIGDLHGAMALFSKAIEKDPQHAVAFFNIGIAYLGFDSTKKAIESWKRYLELDPNSPMRDTVRNFIKMLENGSSS